MNPVDTNKVLRELRGLLAIPSHSTVQRMRVAELFDQLDTALSNGERLPDDWNYGVPRGTKITWEVDMSKCPGIPHRGHASTDWACPYDRES